MLLLASELNFLKDEMEGAEDLMCRDLKIINYYLDKKKRS